MIYPLQNNEIEKIRIKYMKDICLHGDPRLERKACFLHRSPTRAASSKLAAI